MLYKIVFAVATATTLSVALVNSTALAREGGHGVGGVGGGFAFHGAATGGLGFRGPNGFAAPSVGIGRAGLDPAIGTASQGAAMATQMRAIAPPAFGPQIEMPP